MSGRTWVGLDPSIAAFGYAVLHSAGGSRFDVLAVGTWKTKPDADEGKRDDRARRVLSIGRELKALLGEHRPSLVAIESPVLGMKDGKVSVHIAGRVRGLVEGLCVAGELELVEYTAQAVKKATAGRHNASKEEVAAAVRRFYPSHATWNLDNNATDALAVAHVGASRSGPMMSSGVISYRPQEEEEFEVL